MLGLDYFFYGGSSPKKIWFLSNTGASATASSNSRDSLSALRVDENGGKRTCSRGFRVRSEAELESAVKVLDIF